MLEGLSALRGELDAQLAQLEAARNRWSEAAPHRIHLLSVNDRYAERLLRLQLDWLAEAEKTLRAG